MVPMTTFYCDSFCDRIDNRGGYLDHVLKNDNDKLKQKYAGDSFAYNLRRKEDLPSPLDKFSDTIKQLYLSEILGKHGFKETGAGRHYFSGGKDLGRVIKIDFGTGVVTSIDCNRIWHRFDISEIDYYETKEQDDCRRLREKKLETYADY